MQDSRPNKISNGFQYHCKNFVIGVIVFDDKALLISTLRPSWPFVTIVTNQDLTESFQLGDNPTVHFLKNTLFTLTICR